MTVLRLGETYPRGGKDHTTARLPMCVLRWFAFRTYEIIIDKVSQYVYKFAHRYHGRGIVGTEHRAHLTV